MTFAAVKTSEDSYLFELFKEYETVFVTSLEGNQLGAEIKVQRRRSLLDHQQTVLLLTVEYYQALLPHIQHSKMWNEKLYVPLDYSDYSSSG